MELGRYLNDGEQSAYYDWSLKVAAEYFREAKEDTSTFGADIKEFLEWEKKQPKPVPTNIAHDPFRPRYEPSPSDDELVRSLVKRYMWYKRGVLAEELRKRTAEERAAALRKLEADRERIQAQAAATLGSLKADEFVCQQDKNELREQRESQERWNRFIDAALQTQEFANGLFPGIAKPSAGPQVRSRISRGPLGGRGDPVARLTEDPFRPILETPRLEFPAKLAPPKLAKDILPGTRIQPIQREARIANYKRSVTAADLIDADSEGGKFLPGHAWGNPSIPHQGHNVPKSAVADILSKPEAIFWGVYKASGRVVDIYYKDGTVAITQYGQKERVITAYGKLERGGKAEDIAKFREPGRVGFYVEIKVDDPRAGLVLIFPKGTNPDSPYFGFADE